MPRMQRCTVPVATATASLLSLVSFVLLGASSVYAQLPTARLTTIFPPGGKAGTTVDVTIAGVDLDDATALLFSADNITGQPKLTAPTLLYPQPSPIPGQFSVTIGAEVLPGRYDVRVVGRYGVSNPRSFVVDTLEEVVETEPNNSFETAQQITLGSVVSGRADPEAKDFFRFAGTSGQRIIIECAASTIDSRMEGAIALYDEQQNLIARGAASPRDTILDATLPVDGNYTVEVHDLVYAGGEQHFYRLSVTGRPRVDFALPKAGEQPGLTIYGRNLPGGTPTETKLDGAPLEKLEVPAPGPEAKAALPVESAAAGVDFHKFQLAAATGLSNALRILEPVAPVVAEQEPQSKEKPQTLTIPCEVAGQFFPRSDQDWYSFDAKQGQVLWIEVFSHRLGLPADPYLYVARVERNAEGVETLVDVTAVDDVAVTPNAARPNPSFDPTTSDPAFRLVVPADGTYRVLVHDLYAASRGRPDLTYRLTIRPEAPDFGLAAVPEVPSADPNVVGVGTPLLRRGGSVALRVIAFRKHGFAGEIQLSAEGLPAGVTCPPAIIPAGAEAGLLVLHAAEDTAPWSGSISILGKSLIGDKEVVHPARAGTVIWDVANRTVEVPRSRTAAGIALSVVPEVAPAAIAVAGETAWETSVAGKLEIPLKITRRGDFQGIVKVVAPLLPPTIKATVADIPAGSTDGKLLIELQPGATAGNAIIHLQADSQANYTRNPENAALQAQLIAQVEQLAAQFAMEVQTATAAAAAAQQAATEADAALAQATEKFNAAKAAAEAQPADAALATGRAEAEAALADATTKQQAAAAAKTAADAAVAAAAEKQKLAEAEKPVAAKRAADAAEVAKPKPLNFTVYASPIRLKITPAPVAFAAQPAAVAVQQGQKTSAPVSITRLYGYAEPVSLEAEIPPALAGLAIAAVQLPGDAAQTALTVEAGPQTPPGNHTVTLHAKLALNGQNLQVSQPLTVSVQAAQ